MKKWESKIAPAGFFLAGILFVVAAVVPTFRDQPLDAVFLPIGVVFVILGAAIWRRPQRDTPPPRE